MTTTTTTNLPSTTSLCGGAACTTRDLWPLHHIHHRSVSRVCSSCVIRLHLGEFCFSCLDLIAPPLPDDPTLARCSNCPAVAHLTCLPDPLAASLDYQCPSCSGTFSCYPADRTRTPAAFDLQSAKIFVLASKLALRSMKRAAVVASAEAERKVREAILAKKRACEVLEHAMDICKREKEKVAVETAVVAVAVDSSEPVNTNIKKVGRSEVKRKLPEKENGSNKVLRVNSMQNYSPSVLKDQDLIHPHTPNHMKREQSGKEITGFLPSSQDGNGFRGEERGLVAELDKGSRIQLTQDVSISRASNGARMMGMPNTASLHS